MLVWRNRDTILRRTLVALRRIPFNTNRTVPAASTPACGAGAARQRSPAGSTAARPAGIPGGHRGLVRIIVAMAQEDRTVSCERKNLPVWQFPLAHFNFPLAYKYWQTRDFIPARVTFANTFLSICVQYFSMKTYLLGPVVFNLLCIT